ncbi:MAG: hypothetical protein RLZZ200_2126 [Pseudomonadota bacterium]
MALWKDSTPMPPAPAAPETVTPRIPASAPRAEGQRDRAESVIAAGLTVEGKISGQEHVRIAGRFKGDVQVEGNIHIDTGAHVEGQVRATEIIVSGELIGNIDGAKRVELRQGGMISGDVKAGSLTVAAGSRMRGEVDFGWEDSARSVEPKGRSNAA